VDGTAVTKASAGDDVVVDNHATTQAAAHFKNGQLLTIEGAWHNLCQESDLYRIPTLKAMAQFVGQRTNHPIK
jgi:alpha-beta hydrolase superfamily lysophospholipase